MDGTLRDRASLDAAVDGVETVVPTANAAGRGGEDNQVRVAAVVGVAVLQGQPVTLVGDGRSFISNRTSLPPDTF